MATLIALLVGAAGAAESVAASPELDPSFGRDGVATTQLGQPTTAGAVALQPNGRIVVAGNTNYTAYAFTRFRSSGRRDRSFSHDGRARFPGDTTGETPLVTALAATPRNGIVAGGNSGGSSSKEVSEVIRLNRKGRLDRSFERRLEGKPWLLYGPRDVALQPNGGIVGVGILAQGKFCPCSMTAGRLLANGRPDPSFGGDGEVFTSFAPPNGSYGEIFDHSSAANATLVQPDGRIIAAGWAGTGHETQGLGLVRYLPDGSLDPAFAGDGMQTTVFEEGNTEATAAVLQPDGKIIVAGSIVDHSGAFAVARYNADGSLDSTFSGDGRAVTYIADSARATAVMLQPDGKIVVAGDARSASSGQTNFALARFNPEGTLDSTFSDDGTFVASLGNANYRAAGAVLQPDGKIVVAGTEIAGDNTSRFILARFR